MEKNFRKLAILFRQKEEKREKLANRSRGKEEQKEVKYTKKITCILC